MISIKYIYVIKVIFYKKKSILFFIIFSEGGTLMKKNIKIKIDFFVKNHFDYINILYTDLKN